MATQFAVDLVFKTQGGKGVRDAANQLQGLDKKAKGAQQALNNTARGLNNTSRAAATATGNIQRFGVAFRSTVAPIVAAYGAINFFNRSLKVMGDREADAAVLANGLRKVGAEAGQLDRLQKIASKLGEQTLFNQEDFTQGFALLTSFRAIGVSSYERVAKAAADMATVTKTGVNESLLQLSKALENPVQGMSALSRSGTTFTESQKGVVKALVESGRQLEAQQYLLNIVEGQYKGASSEAAKGFAGQMDTLNETFRDFQEVVGKGVLPIVTELVKGMTETFRALSQVDPKLLTTAGKAAVFAAKLVLVNKAIKAMIGLRAGVAAMLAGTATNATAAGNASAIAAGKVRALAASLRTLAAIGIVTVGVEYLFNGARTGASIEDLNKRLEAGGTGAALKSGGKSTTREQVVESQRVARETIKAAEAELKSMKPPGWLSALPIIGPAMIGSQGGRIQQLQGRIADAKTVLGLDANKFQQQAQALSEGFDVLTGGDEGGGKGGKGEDLAKELERSLAAGVQLSREFSRQVQLLKAEGEVEKALLEVQFNKQDRELQIAELKSQEQQATAKLLSDELARLQTLEAMAPLVKQMNEERLQGASYGDGKVVEQLNPNGKIGDYLKQTNDWINDTEGRIVELAGSMESNLAGAFQSILDGSKSTQEAFADMFRGIAASFLQMATQMIAKMIIMSILNKLLGGILGGGAGASIAGTDWGGMGTSQFSGGFGIDTSGLAGPLTPFADGGIVRRPTRALIGEAGPEAVIPLSEMSKMSSGGDVNSVVNVTINSDGSSSTDASQGERLGRQINSAVKAVIMHERRPGGLLSR